MEWGFFTLAHIISIIIAILLIVIVHFSIYKCKNEVKTIVLFVLSLIPIIAIAYNLIHYKTPLEHLPLDVCEIGALIMPFVVLFPRKGPANFLLINVLAAVGGLLFNHAPEYGYYSVESIMYYFPMVISFGLPILIFTLDLSELDIKYLPMTLGVTILIYTSVYFLSSFINSYCAEHEILNIYGDIIFVNYMGSQVADNAILEAFFNIIPYKYWYMSIGLAIDFIYLVLIYGIHNYVVRVRKTNEIE